MGAFVVCLWGNREGVISSKEQAHWLGTCQIQLRLDGPYKLIMNLYGWVHYCCTFMHVMLCTKPTW